MKLKQQMMKQGKASVASCSLPCLNRNISIGSTTAPVKWGWQADTAEAAEARLNEFTTAHRKSAYVLQLNVKSFIDRHGIDRVGFLTLTFADDVKDPKEAQRRFNSLRTNFLKHHYKHYIRVVERTKTGRIHYHLLVACKENIRRGLNFRQIAARNYKSANAAIRGHWARLREAMGKTQFIVHNNGTVTQSTVNRPDLAANTSQA
uniref:rolling circle replication-associated protein n=1 Tax=Eikenella corrodens TaxID=539 RepID=UPI003B968B6E